MKDIAKAMGASAACISQFRDKIENNKQSDDNLGLEFFNLKIESAAEMRVAGHLWREIAKTLRYKTNAAAFLSVKGHFGTAKKKDLTKVLEIWQDSP